MIAQFLFNGHQRPLQFGPCSDVKIGGEYGGTAEFSQFHPPQRIDLGNGLNFISKELDTNGNLVLIGRIHIHNIAAHAKASAEKVEIISFILNFHEVAQHVVAFLHHAFLNRQYHTVKILGRADAIYA